MACSSPPVKSTKRLAEVETILQQNTPVLISEEFFERLEAS
jgi:hypothetical protein